MNSERTLIGDWVGTIYDVSGSRTDWKLSLFRDGTYARQIDSANAPIATEKGEWTVSDTQSILFLTPDKEEPTRWTIHDITRLECANTFLVLRPQTLGSRILPILLYRIHPLPGPPMPLDAHGFVTNGH